MGIRVALFGGQITHNIAKMIEFCKSIDSFDFPDVIPSKHREEWHVPKSVNSNAYRSVRNCEYRKRNSVNRGK